jgi:hypothetical protein
MAHLEHNSEIELPVNKAKTFEGMCIAIPNTSGMKIVKERLLIKTPEHSLKKVQYHVSSIVGKCLIGILLAIMFVNTNAQSTALSRFHYGGSDERVMEAIKIADSILSTQRFWNDLRNWKDQYIDNTDTLSYSMAKLADTLKAYQKITNIRLAPKISSHISTAKTDENGTLITRRGYKQDLNSLAVTIIHEWAHAVDYVMHGANNLKFGHFNDQHRCLNKETASYRVERVAELILGNPDFALKCDCQLPCYLPCEIPSPCPKVQ